MKTNFLKPGSIISGTCVPSEIIEALLDAFDNLQGRDIASIRAVAKVRKQYKVIAEDDDAYDLRDDLMNVLSEYAPPFMSVGTHPDDGADVGVWLAYDWRQDLLDDGGVVVRDLSQVPVDHTSWVAVVSDHGNVSLYKGHSSYCYWSLV